MSNDNNLRPSGASENRPGRAAGDVRTAPGDARSGAPNSPKNAGNGGGQARDYLLSAAPEGAEVRKLRRHEVLFERGDPARELFLVQADAGGGAPDR